MIFQINIWRCCALLCRENVKGQDWYDFLWYARNQIRPNFLYLENALAQLGPWQNSRPRVDAAWLQEALSERISALDWKEVARDVASFLPTPELAGLGIWSRDFFSSQLNFLNSMSNSIGR